jgi:Predicted transcriptional regulators
MSASAVAAIGERLREARLRKGMSVRGLARAVDVSASLISQIETGKSSPSVSTLYAITTALGISIEDVFGDPGGGRTGENAGGAADAGQADAAVSPAAAESGTGDGPGTARPGDAAGMAAVLGMAASLATAPGERPAAAPGDGGDEGAGEGAAAGRPGQSATARGLRMLSQKRLVGPVVRADQRERLLLDSGVTWELLGQLPDTHVDFLRITYAPGGSSSSGGMLMRHSGTEFGHVLSGRLTLTLGFETYELGPGDSVCFDSSTPHAYANHGTEPAVGVWFVLERFR